MNRSRQNSDSKFSSGEGKIIEGEKVLCYHGNYIYEAKCLKIRNSEKDPDKVEYFIHYAGWSKKWEEWVEEGRVLKYTEENVKKQQNLKDEEKPVKKTPGRKSSTAEKDKDSGSSRPCSPAVSVKSNKSNQDTSGKDEIEVEPKRRKLSKTKPKPKEKKEKVDKEKKTEKEKEEEEDVVEDLQAEKTTVEADEKEESKPKKMKVEEVKEDKKEEEEEKKDIVKTNPPPPPTKCKFKVIIPRELCHCIINDYNFVVHKQFLTKVPAKITVKQMFEEYLLSKGADQQLEIQYNGLTEFVKGLIEYVDEMLGVQLLYRFEKPQYKTIKEQYPNVKMNELYGPILMVRLLTRLELAFDTLLLSPKRFKLVDLYLRDVFKFLIANYNKYFNEDIYDAATPDYLRLALK